MGRELNRLLTAVLRPPLEIVVYLAKGLYKPLFGNLDLRMSRKNEKDLMRDIRAELGFFFEKHRGQLTQDESVKHPQPFDYAYAIVSTDEMVFRFFRGRGELRVWLAPKSAPRDWAELNLLIAVVNPDEKSPWTPFSSLRDAAEILKAEYDHLAQALAQNQITSTRRRLVDLNDYERAVIRQYETEINRRLYPER